MTRARRDERGFVLVVTACLIVVLCMFAGLAIDFGSFYVRAAQIKRATDAAALAGVVWMPEFDAAQAAALEAAARNGFVHGQNNVSVSVQPIEGNTRQLRVTITDSRVKQYFSRVVIQRQGLTRASTAEYVLPVPLGSPKNTFGTGNLLGDSATHADRENFWAAVNGYCAGAESGDDKLARYESYSTASGSGSGITSTNCHNNSQQSTTYNADGYLYAINLPVDVAGSLKLEIYDAPYFTTGSPRNPPLSPDSRVANGNQQVTTYYDVYNRNPTPLNLSPAYLETLRVKTVQYDTDQDVSNLREKWTRIQTWNNPKAGQYYLRVRTKGLESNSRGANAFAIRAFTTTNFSTCSTESGASNYLASCPQVHGVSDISILANVSNSAGATPTFYLAQIDPVHAGKTMRVKLFDAGEGASSIEVLDPNGSPATFTWSTACNPPTPPSGGCSGTGTLLDVSGGTVDDPLPQPYSGLQSGSKYNDRYLTLDIPLPANYTTLYGAKRWWKVRYGVGTAPTDRTTWSVNIVGDPVHLVK